MIEINDLSVVDVHCHPFLKHENLSDEQFVERVAFPGGGVDFLVDGAVPAEKAAAEVNELRRDTLFVRFLVNQLAGFFGCEPTLEQVVEARNRCCQEDFTGYVRRLYTACSLTGMVADFGYPKPLLDVEQFKALSPIKVTPIYRIESFIDSHLQQDISWEDLNGRYEDTLANALENQGFLGLKSIIAYRTGLEISPLSRTPDQGRLAWDAVRRGVGSYKPLRDHLLCRAIEICIDYDVPLQIHTGIGDYEINLVGCRPALLLDLLRFPAFRACKVLLVHAGYPYHSEAGYLTNILPRVYCDVSEGIPFGAHAARRIFAEVLEMAPISKVLYGSDGYVVPEIAYASAVLGKRALAQVLDDVVESNMLSSGEARRAARLILAENALSLYDLAS